MKSQKIKTILLLLSLGLFVNLYGQEYLFTKGQNAMPFTAEIVGGKLFFSATEKGSLDGGPIINSTLYMADLNLNLLDSIDFGSDYNISRAGLVAIDNVGDSLVAVAVSSFDFSDTGYNDLILFIDTDMDVKDSIRYQGKDATRYIRNINITDSLLWVMRENRDLQSNNIQIYPLISFYDLNARQKDTTIEYPQVSEFRNGFNEVGRFNGKWIVTEFNELSPRHFYTMNDNFEVDSIYEVTFNPPNGRVPYRLYNFLYSGPDYLYTAGQVKQSFISMVKYDKDLRAVRLDTFLVPGWPHFNHYGCNDFITLDSVFLASSEEEVGDVGLLHPVINDVTVQQDIHVYNMDTAGNVNWSTIISQDSVYFRLWEVVATPDGGAFIISSKYDPFYKAQIHHRISIIKMDRNGQVVSEREWALPQAFSLYPNPTKGMVHIEGLESHQIFTATLYDLKGEKVLEKDLGHSRQLNMAELPSGTYLLQLSDENGNAKTEKLIVK